MFIPGKVIIDRKRVREALFPTEHGPIIWSRLQNDWYKYSMGQFFARNYRDVRVRYGFFNRTKSIRLADEISEADLRRELDHVKNLRYTAAEIAYLANIRNDGAFMFGDSYLEDLMASTLPDYDLTVKDGQFEIKTEGQWHQTCDWEIYQLAIISALRTDALMRKLSPAEQDEVVEYTAKMIEEKILTLRQHPRVYFSDFGTRRAASPLLQMLIDEYMLEYLPRGQFMGTSNVLFAKELQTMATGTDAHERQMVMAALTNSDEELREVPVKAFREWWKLYGWGLSIMLTDTFGSEWLFKNLPEEFARNWKGCRPDSMNLVKYGEMQIQFYRKFNQDSRERMIIPSDGLTLESMLKVTYHFEDRMKVRSGWGTLCTNDTGLGHPSIVTKAIAARAAGENYWRPTVKLSDNIQKALSTSQPEIKRYTGVFDYHASDNKECEV